MRSDPREVVRRFWESVWSNGDAEALTEVFDPHIRENGESVDVEAFKRAVTAWRQVFPDFTATVEELIPIDQDRVVSRVTYTGTQRLPWAGLPAKGRPFQVIGIDIFRVRDGRIVEFWHSADHYIMAVQLGGKLVPADPSTED
ncbi:MAG: ester cyclase [Actinomycetota bacterium]